MIDSILHLLSSHFLPAFDAHWAICYKNDTQ